MTDRPPLLSMTGVRKAFPGVQALADARLEVRAGEVVALLTDDVQLRMPPVPLEYQGRELTARFLAVVAFRQGRTYQLVASRANGQPAFGSYLRSPTGISHGVGLYVLTLTGEQICGMTRFENSVLPWFKLPRSLPSR